MILILRNVSVAIYRMLFFVGLSSSLDDVCYYRDWYEEGPIDRVLFVCWPHTCTGHNSRDSIKKRIIYSPLFITKFAIYFSSSALFAHPHHRHHGRWNYLLVTVFCLPPTVTKWIYTRRHNNYPQSDPGWSLVVTRRMSRSDAGGDRGTDKFDEHVFIYFSHTKYHFQSHTNCETAARATTTHHEYGGWSLVWQLLLLVESSHSFLCFTRFPQ